MIIDRLNLDYCDVDAEASKFDKEFLLLWRHPNLGSLAATQDRCWAASGSQSVMRAERMAPPVDSDVNLLGDLNRIIDFDAEIPDGALDLCVTK